VVVAANGERLDIDADTIFVSTQMLKKFRVSMTFGQVMNLYEAKGQVMQSEDEDDDIIFDINLYLKRDQLPSSLGCFNNSVPHRIMLVQMNLVIEGCELNTQSVQLWLSI
jgi:hypothetical protein